MGRVWLDDTRERRVGIQCLVDRTDGLGEGANTFDGGSRIGVPGHEKHGARRRACDDRFGIEVLEHFRDKVIDPVGFEHSVVDEVLVAGHARDGDARFGTIIQRHEPPRSGAAHADSGDPDAVGVDFWAV